MIDLHTHSTFSDGSLTPEELAAKSRDAGLTAVALTDHDTVAGVPRFIHACNAAGITGISGVEISADIDKGGLHVLGYCVDTDSPSLARLLSEIREGRSKRNMVILRNLNDAGLALSFDEVAAYAGEDNVGRPHFAQAMLAKGYVSSKEEAFEKYLKKGRPGYADRFRLSPEGSMAAIHDAGGLPVLAHPFTLEMSNEDLLSFVKRMADAGLEGIEVYYSEHNPSQVKAYRDIALKSGLLLTGGSDFHGAVNPAVQLGKGFGNLKVNDDLLEKLLSRKADRADGRK